MSGFGPGWEKKKGCPLAVIPFVVSLAAVCIVSKRCGSRWHRWHELVAWVRRHV